MRIFKFAVFIALIVFVLACSEDTIGRLRSKTTALATVYCLPDPLVPGNFNVEPIVFFGAGNPGYHDDYQPISDATVVVTSGTSRSVRLLEDPAAPGTYGPDTYNNFTLPYLPANTYTFTITSEGFDYSLTISTPQAPTTLITSISSSTNASVDISLEPDYPYEFVLVFDSEGNRILDTRPKTASELSRVILDNSSPAPSSVPVKSLPPEDICRIVVLGGVEGLREDISPNLSILSTIIAAGAVSKTLDVKNLLE